MSLVLNVALASNRDGRLELVATSIDEAGPHAVWHAWQTTPSGSWTGWHLLGRPGEPAGYDPPAVIRTGDGCLDVVLITSEAQVWHRRQTEPNNGWSRWQSLGRPAGHIPHGDAGAAPALAVNAAGRLEIFVIVEEGVWHAAQQPGPVWSAWSSLGRPGGLGCESLAVEASVDGRLELFALAFHPPTVTREAIWHRSQRATGGWSDWSSLGTPTADVRPGGPTLFRSPDGRLELLTVASDGAVWHRRQEAPGGQWSDWSSLGSQAGGFADVASLAVCPTADGWPLLVAATNNDTDLWQRRQTPDDDWLPWSPIATPATRPTERPTLAANADGRLELFVRTDIKEWYQLSQMTPDGPWSAGQRWPDP